MTKQEVLDFLANVERRVAVLETEARQTLERAEQTLAHLAGLHGDLGKTRRALRDLALPGEQDTDPSEDTPRP
jgi:hypothetical protein